MKYPITRLVRYLKRTKQNRHKRVRALFFKSLLLFIELYAMAMLGMSYYLAYIGREVVLEELSKTLVKTIIYPFLAYTINRTVENLAEHNITQFHKPLSEEPIESEDSI